ncbi:MAG: PQQ-like beta-propeller repeat protein [Planctomycetales bacterium]|nr:PQQ-like beta-propeller repeat protein [Planctomycetales bacterium]
MFRCCLIAVLISLSGPSPECRAGRRVIMQGDNRLAIVEADGSVSWEMPWGGIHDIHVLPDGHIMVQQDMHKVVEIDPAAKEIVWSYDSATAGGNEGRPVEVHAFEPLDDGRVMIAESGPGRLIEINRAGKILHQVKLRVEHPDAHRDTRLVRKLPSGNYLVCHEGDGVVREYDGSSGEVAWEYEVPLFDHPRADGHGPEAFGNQVFAALRLKNGNTLIATGNGHSVLEVTPDKQIVWQLSQHDLPGITLAWVTTLEVLPNGHYVIGNCHAGPGQPLLVEIDPATKEVVWTFDRYDLFGNSASNSQVLGADGEAIR